MFRKFLLSIGILLTVNMLVFSQSGTLKGKITNKDTQEPIPFANVIIEMGGKQYGGSTTNFDGDYTIKPIPVGKYTVKSSYVGFKSKVTNNVIINNDKYTYLDLKMTPTVETLEVVEVTEYAIPLISKDNTTSGETVTADEIAKLPGRSAGAIAATMGGVFSEDGQMGSIRGARSGAVTYIDGVRVIGSASLPKSAQAEISVLQGGIPAKYGEATGGILNIVTFGPSRQFGGNVELVTSELFDSYGYNILGFSLNGPILKSKDPQKSSSLLGFFIAGEVSSIKDGRPFAIDRYRVKDDVLAELETNPLRPSGTGNGSYENAEFIHMDDLTKIKYRENASSNSINLTGKIDVRTTNYTNLTFGGQYNYSKGYNWSAFHSMFNWDNIGQTQNTTYRIYGKFTQRFPADKESKSLINNVFYQIQVDYSKFSSKTMDPEHLDNFFNYGYVGKFTTYKSPFYQPGTDTVDGIVYNNVWLLTNFYDSLVTFQPSEMNPILANYTQQYYDRYDLYSGAYRNKTNIQTGLGLLNGYTPGNVYGLYAAPGTPATGYGFNDMTQIGLNANGSADIGNHAIEFGLQYEQRSSRAYNLGVIGLWTLMNDLANAHIGQLDLDNPNPVFDNNGVFQDTINYTRLYDEASQRFFDINLRNKLGLAIDGTDWIDIDNLDPSTFSIDMFSADELLNQGNAYVGYYGYTYTGEKLTKNPTFDDFFTEKDEFGNFKREIAPFEPIYLAGYIQDKFAFKDLIFNIGLRIDRFDANQMVLKDPWLFYPAKTVDEVNDPDLGTHPSNMGGNYVVYVNDFKDPSAILGYRDGETWFDANGVEIEDPSILRDGTSTGNITPYLVDPDQKTVSSNAFKDYEPQTTVMPRIAFSFPISDEALFFAHYDVITRRPYNILTSPVNYLFIENSGGATLNNPNLKPEKNVDYELGFRQKISSSSALQISVYYREVRDQIQFYRYSEAYPVSYYSYNNIDFGTVKGLIISYDLRRTNNIRIRTSYTLQFAEGTGSSSTSQRNLVTSGFPNLRILSPLNQDQRHSIKAVIDYRYGAGNSYNGPVSSRRIKGTDKVKTTKWLENTGLNLTFNGGSGKPYTARRQVSFGGASSNMKGLINGSRYPWQFWIDARIDRNFMLKFGKEKSKKRVAYVNVYLQILNVLNSLNILNIYPTTGNPDDDGFLSAPEYQKDINSQIDTQSFIDLYRLSINSPYNYSRPRRIRLGIMFNF